MDILSNLLVSHRGRFLGGQNCSAWRAKNSAGRVYNDEDEDEDEDGVEVFTVSSRQCSRTGADLSSTFDSSIPCRAVPTRGRKNARPCVSSGCRLRQISRRHEPRTDDEVKPRQRFHRSVYDIGGS